MYDSWNLEKLATEPDAFKSFTDEYNYSITASAEEKKERVIKIYEKNVLAKDDKFFIALIIKNKELVELDEMRILMINIILDFEVFCWMQKSISLYKELESTNKTTRN